MSGICKVRTRGQVGQLSGECFGDLGFRLGLGSNLLGKVPTSMPETLLASILCIRAILAMVGRNCRREYSCIQSTCSNMFGSILAEADEQNKDIVRYTEASQTI